MSTAIQATGFIMAIISWLINGAALANDSWKISTVSGSIIISQRQFVNLWHACAENSAGIAECRDFETMLALPGYVQACRALMIICLLLGLISMVVSVLGLKCIRIGSATDQSKVKVLFTGGILSILSGLCCMVACSWYAFRVVEDFNNPFYGGEKFELGTGLYLGWAGSSLSILGGAFLCTACKGKSSGVKRGGYPGDPPKRVYTAAANSEAETSKAYV